MRNLRNNVKAMDALSKLGLSLLALAVSLAITGILIAICGYNPFEIYYALFVQSFSSTSSVALILSEATPMIFAGLAFVVGIKVGLINVGVEGQMFSGAMCAALVGAYCTWLPGPLMVPACLAAGIIGGGLTFLLCTYLKDRFGASEVITSIMMNSIMAKVTEYLCNGPLKPPGVSIGQTKEIVPSAYLTALIPKTRLTWAFPLAILCCVLIYVMLDRTVVGYKMRVTGINKTASVVAGIRTNKMYFLAAFLSGAFAGLGGAGLVMGVYHRFMDGITSGVGFIGVSVAALAAYSPLAVPVSGALFGMLSAATTTLSRTTDAPLEIMDIIQGLVVVFVSAPRIVTSLKDWRIFKPLKRAFRKPGKEAA
jgi:simple sugar transport system permease protein